MVCIIPFSFVTFPSCMPESRCITSQMKSRICTMRILTILQVLDCDKIEAASSEVRNPIMAQSLLQAKRNAMPKSTSVVSFEHIHVEEHEETDNNEKSTLPKLNSENTSLREIPLSASYSSITSFLSFASAASRCHSTADLVSLQMYQVRRFSTFARHNANIFCSDCLCSHLTAFLECDPCSVLFASLSRQKVTVVGIIFHAAPISSLQESPVVEVPAVRIM